jgi:hypothetical protein
MAETDTDKAIALEIFFSSVYTVEDDQIFDLLSSRITEHSKQMADIKITQEDILDKLNKLKIDKSPGLDLIHPRVMYETRSIIACPLWLIFNKSISLGVIPSDWKMAEVTAVYKKRI